MRSGKVKPVGVHQLTDWRWFNNYIKDGPLYVVLPNEAKSFRGDDRTNGKSGFVTH